MKSFKLTILVLVALLATFVVADEAAYDHSELRDLAKVSTKKSKPVSHHT